MNRFCRYALLLAAVSLFVYAQAFAQTPPPPQCTYTINGRIRNVLGRPGDPVNDTLRVYINGEGYMAVAPDKDGLFSFPAPPAASLFIEFFEGQEFPFLHYPRTYEGVVNGNRTIDFVAYPKRETVVWGAVRDSSGSQLNDVRVLFTTSVYSATGVRTTPTVEVNTRDLGVFGFHCPEHQDAAQDGQAVQFVLRAGKAGYTFKSVSGWCNLLDFEAVQTGLTGVRQ